VHPDGGFVYGSNRGDDSIATFTADPVDGTLTLVETVSSGGQTPRNFEVAADGTLMLVANQNSDNIVAFSIDGVTGLPEATGEVASVSSPSFVGIVYLPGPDA
jgi:6-phosphogluconolactonase